MGRYGAEVVDLLLSCDGGARQTHAQSGQAFDTNPPNEQNAVSEQQLTVSSADNHLPKDICSVPWREFRCVTNTIANFQNSTTSMFPAKSTPGVKEGQTNKNGRRG